MLAWRERPHHAIAELLGRLSAPAATPQLSLPSAGKHVDMSAWKASLQQGSALALGVLLDALGRVPQPALKEQIELLGQLAPDPRIAEAYVRLLQAPPYTASALKPAWTSLFSQLREVHRDPRTAPALAPLAGRYQEIFGFSVMGKWMDERIGKLVLELSPVPSVPDLSSLEQELLQQIDAALGVPLPATKPAVATVPASPERQLLDAIAAAPHEAAPREAYERWCQQNAPERAEFIALSQKNAAKTLDDAGQKRAASLLKKHWKSWMGPVAQAIVEPRVEHFEQGYLAFAIFSASPRKAQEAVGDPRWATVHSLEFQGLRRVPAPLFLHPVLRSWRVARELSHSFFQELWAHDEELPLEWIETEGPDLEHMRAEDDPISLKNVRTLGLSTWMSTGKGFSRWEDLEVFRPLWKIRWMRRITRVDLDAGFEKEEKILAELNEHVPAEVKAVFAVKDSLFERDKKGRYRKRPG